MRIVRAGYLFPLGHPASLVKVTERRLERGVAALRQRMFLVVREPLLRYDAAPTPAAARQLPFTAIRLETLVAPDIDAPRPLPNLGVDAVRAFRVDVGGQPLRFHVAGTDREARTVHFTLPLFFLDENVAVDDARVRTLRGPKPEGPILGMHRHYPSRALNSQDSMSMAVAVAQRRTPTATLSGISLRAGQERPHLTARSRRRTRASSTAARSARGRGRC